MDEEAKLKERYDRQIRVWGAEAQTRIQTSRVLVLGLQGLNVEVTKNIVLAGMSVTVQDDSLVSLEDLSFNFFLTADNVGMPTAEAALPRIQQLNSFTTVGVETRSIKDLDAAFFAPFTVVIMSAKNSTEEEALRVNALCRASPNKKVFFLSDVFGHDGYFVSDFGSVFEFQPDKKKEKEGAPTASESAVNIQTISFPPLSTVFGKAWADLPSKHFPLSKTFVKARLLMLFRDANGGTSPSPDTYDAFRAWAHQVLAQNRLESPSSVLSDEEVAELTRTASCTPVVTCSTLGSFLAQEVIKGVSLSGQPGLNVWVFSSHDYQVRAFPVLE